jgi:tetratricopeptide (TPR) repeat protein
MEKYYFKMLKAAPGSKVAIEGLINLYSKRNEFDLALEWYDKLLTKFPVESDIGFDLGSQLIDAKRYRQAVIVLRKVLEVRRDYDVLYMLGVALAWAGEKDEAEKYLIEAAELDPTDYRAFYSLGYVYRDTGRYEKAKEAWVRVLKLFPNFPEVENNIRSIEKLI